MRSCAASVATASFRRQTGSPGHRPFPNRQLSESGFTGFEDFQDGDSQSRESFHPVNPDSDKGFAIILANTSGSFGSPCSSKGGLELGRPPAVCKAAYACDFTLTPPELAEGPLPQGRGRTERPCCRTRTIAKSLSRHSVILSRAKNPCLREKDSSLRSE